MCLGIPARIISIRDSWASAEIGGITRDVSLALVPEAKLGDYILLHAGFGIQILDEREAQETLKLLEELAAMYPDQEERPLEEVL